MRARSASEQAPSSSRQPRASATLVPASQICTPLPPVGEAAVKVERVREAEQGLPEYESGEKEGSWVGLTRVSWRE